MSRHSRLSVFLFLAFLSHSSYGHVMTKAEIEALRAEIEAKGYTFTVGENPATQRPLEQLCGFRPELGVSEPELFSEIAVRADLPSHYDWRDRGMVPPVRDQGACGSCWAFATVAPLECNIAWKDGRWEDLSEQFLVSCNRAWPDRWGCNGGWWAHDLHVDPGAVLESEFPYQAWDVPCGTGYNFVYRIESWGRVYGTNSIKQAIVDYGPVGTLVHVGDAFRAYTGGVFDFDEGESANHAVVLVGWDDSEGCWIMRNSWGPYWGEQGYMRIAYGVSRIGIYATFIRYTRKEATWTPTQSPTVTPTPYPGLIWQDGFDDGVIDREPPEPDWEVQERNGAIVAERNGVLRIDGIQGQQSYGGVYNPDHAWGDFALLTKVHFADATNTAAAEANAEVGFRMISNSHGYGLCFQAIQDRITLRRTDLGEALQGKEISWPVNTGSAFYVWINALGPELRIRVGTYEGAADVANWVVQDETFESGYFMLFNYQAMAVEFDYIWVAAEGWVPFAPTPTPSGTPTVTATSASTPLPDRDRDGLPDAVEGPNRPGTNQANWILPDSDGDGLRDGTEDENCDGTRDPLCETDPISRDSDGDLYEDGLELTLYMTDPLNAAAPGTPYLDTDEDGIANSRDPAWNNPDADGDRISDGFEAAVLGVSAATDSEHSPPLGDANHNRVRDNADSQLILAFFASIPVVYVDPGVSDLNRDAVVDNADSQKSLNYFARIEPVLPVR